MPSARYELLYPAHADMYNRISEVGTAALFQVCGLVDLDAGGIVGYISADFADEIVRRLNNA